MKDDGAAAAERPAEAPTDAADAGPGPNSAAVAAAAGSAGLFRRKKGGANIRKRGGAEGGSDDDEAGGGVVRKAKAAKSDAPLAFTTKKDDKDALLVEFAGSKALQDGKDTLATRGLETETEYDRDAR